jgi:hypothetical protein
MVNGQWAMFGAGFDLVISERQPSTIDHPSYPLRFLVLALALEA